MMEEKFVIKRLQKKIFAPCLVDYAMIDGMWSVDIFCAEHFNTYEDAKHEIRQLCFKNGNALFQIEKIFVP